MAEPLFHFIEEILKDAEQRREKEKVEMNKLRADGMLKAVAVLDSQMLEVNALCDTEIARIETFRQQELSRLDKKRSWLTFNLQAYITETDEKTIRLPNGILKLRKGRDRVAIVDMPVFLEKASRLGLLKAIPESYQPDMPKVMEYLKRTGSVPAGCELIPAETRFSYSTISEEQADGTDADETKRKAEARTPVESNVGAQLDKG